EGHLAAVAAHGPVRAILITHGHPDHVEGVSRLAEILGGVPVGTEPPDGSDPPAGTGLAIRAIPTPGHPAHPVSFHLTLAATPAPGHPRDSVSFHVTVGAEQAVRTGDPVRGRGTTVVAWPDGALGDSLASLRALTAFGQVPVLPGHGPPLADCAVAAAFYLR